MLNPKMINKLSELLLDKLPNDLSRARENIRQNIADTLESKLSEWGLVSKEELKSVYETLEQYRKQVDQLKRRIEELEKRQGE